jgi:hypothetical protein
MGIPLQPRVSIPSGPMTVVFHGSRRSSTRRRWSSLPTDIRDRVAATGMLPEGHVRVLRAPPGCPRPQLRLIAATGKPLPHCIGCAARSASPAHPSRWQPTHYGHAAAELDSGAAPPLGPVQYRLRIVPIYDGQDRRSAIERNSPHLRDRALGNIAAVSADGARPLRSTPDATGFAWQGASPAARWDARQRATRGRARSSFSSRLRPTPSAEGGPPGHAFRRHAPWRARSPCWFPRVSLILW